MLRQLINIGHFNLNKIGKKLLVAARFAQFTSSTELCSKFFASHKIRLDETLEQGFKHGEREALAEEV